MKIEVLKTFIDEAKNCFDKNFASVKSKELKFYHLCFVLLVPQTSFLLTKKAIDNLMNLNFYKNDLSEAEISEAISFIRFKNRKAKYLFEMKKKWRQVYSLLWDKYVKSDPFIVRDWLVNQIDGLGMKTASHFMRNVGYDCFAIIDTHLLKFLSEDSPKTIKEYKILENKFILICNHFETKPAILDLAVWKYYSGINWNEIIF